MMTQRLALQLSFPISLLLRTAAVLSLKLMPTRLLQMLCGLLQAMPQRRIFHSSFPILLAMRTAAVLYLQLMLARLLQML